MNALITNETLTDIGDAIRAKLGTNATMLPSEMPGNIRNISGGGSGTYQQKTVHPALTSQTVSPDTGYNALSSVTVEAMELQTKTATPSTQQQTISPDAGKDGLSSVTVAAATLQEKTATLGAASQDITPDSGYYGLSKVTVPASQSFKTQAKSVSPTTSSQTVTPDSGYDGLSQVSVGAIQTETKIGTPQATQQAIVPTNGKYLAQVTIEAAPLQEKTAQLSASQQDVVADSGYYGLSKVTVPAAPTFTTKTITANGTYSASSDNADGYSSVSVSVQTPNPSFDLLWTNGSPSADFAAQKVFIDLSLYDAIILRGKFQTVDGTFIYPSLNFSQCYIQKGKSGVVVLGANVGSQSREYYSQRTVQVEPDGVTFSIGSMYGYADATGENFAIPLEIYGVKGTI